MKGLFKSKPRTPADIVRQTRDLFLYADRSNSLPDLRESKREEKVSPLSFPDNVVGSLSLSMDLFVEYWIRSCFEMGFDDFGL